jgi:hypothetical protein
LLREDRLDSESGDEKDEGHCEASVVGVRVGIVMSVVEEKDGVGESDEADLERGKGFEDDVKRWCRLRSCCCCLSSPLFVIIAHGEGAQRGSGKSRWEHCVEFHLDFRYKLYQHSLMRYSLSL